MNLLFELLPVFAFLITYKWVDLYAATASLIGTSILQLLFYKMQSKSIPITQWINFAFIGLMGSATLIFQNEAFIKWKPTIFYWTLASACGLSPYFTKTNLTEQVISPLIKPFIKQNTTLPHNIWILLNRYWIMCFLSLGLLNIVVAYSVTTATWVSFKLLGILGLQLFFLIIQTIYLSRFLNLNHASS